MRILPASPSFIFIHFILFCFVFFAHFSGGPWITEWRQYDHKGTVRRSGIAWILGGPRPQQSSGRSLTLPVIGGEAEGEPIRLHAASLPLDVVDGTVPRRRDPTHSARSSTTLSLSVCPGRKQTFAYFLFSFVCLFVFWPAWSVFSRACDFSNDANFLYLFLKLRACKMGNKHNEIDDLTGGSVRR